MYSVLYHRYEWVSGHGGHFEAPYFKMPNNDTAQYLPVFMSGHVKESETTKVCNYILDFKSASTWLLHNSIWLFELQLWPRSDRTAHILDYCSWWNIHVGIYIRRKSGTGSTVSLLWNDEKSLLVSLNYQNHIRFVLLVCYAVIFPIGPQVQQVMEIEVSLHVLNIYFKLSYRKPGGVLQKNSYGDAQSRVKNFDHLYTSKKRDFVTHLYTIFLQKAPNLGQIGWFFS